MAQVIDIPKDTKTLLGKDPSLIRGSSKIRLELKMFMSILTEKTGPLKSLNPDLKIRKKK